MEASTSGRQLGTFRAFSQRRCCLRSALRARQGRWQTAALLERPLEGQAGRKHAPHASGAPQSSLAETTSFATLLATASFLWPAGLAFAEEAGVAYDPKGGDELLKNAAGIAYVILVGIFIFRLLRKRASNAKSERLAGQMTAGPNIFTELREKVGANKPAKATPLNAFLGSGQALLLAYGMWIFSTKVSAAIQGQAMPDAYLARNITVTVRTILLGLCYLATFIFGANGVGLAGLSLQLLLFPGSIKDDVVEEEDAASKGPQLPKVRVTARTGDVRAAFNAAERQGQQQVERAAAASAAAGPAAARASDAAAAGGGAGGGRDAAGSSASSSSVDS